MNRLGTLHTVMDKFDIDSSWIYPTHVQRNEKLMAEAIDLVKRGATIDCDTVENDLPRWLRFYFERDGDRTRITASSDAAITGPHHLFEQMRASLW